MEVSTDPLPAFVMQQRVRVGRRIRVLREGQELTQEKLAELAGIARHSVYRTELATHSASLDHLTLIARALGVRVEDLVRE